MLIKVKYLELQPSVPLHVYDIKKTQQVLLRITAFS